MQKINKGPSKTKEDKKIDKNPIKKDSNIAEIVFKYPEVVEIFAAFGLHCASCFASQFDTVGEGAKLHGMIDEEIEEMIEEANIVLNARFASADNKEEYYAE